MRAQAASLADRALTRAIFGRHPYGHPGIGDPEAVRATTVDEIRAFHSHGYQVRATTLVVAGDLDVAEGDALAERAFGAWAPEPTNGAGRLLAETPAARGRVLVVARPGASQSELRVGQVSAARNTPDYHALLLWNAVLGGQFVSRLNLNLRQEKGYTYGVRSGFDFRRDRGPFSIHTSVQATATADATSEILREVRDLQSTRPVTPEELARAKAAVGLGYPRGFETAQQVARAVAQMSLHDIGPDHFEQFVPRLNAVTLAEVAAAAARHVRPDCLTAVVVGDPAMVEPQLHERGLAYDVAAEEIA